MAEETGDGSANNLSGEAIDVLEEPGYANAENGREDEADHLDDFAASAQPNRWVCRGHRGVL